ncbi:MAG: class I SAM-dependent methyltransferase [bacterium]|nr:class I SAM-dependent methyltransferase [bacterium]
MAYFKPVKDYQLHLIRKVMDQYPVRSPFLEIGCGKGDFLRFFHQEGLNGKGIDTSKEALQFARRQGLKGIIVKEQDLFTEKGRYSFIIMIDVLEHIKDDTRALKKVRSLLAPSGFFVFQVPSHSRKYGWIDAQYGHYRRYDRRDILRLAEVTGLRIEKMWCSGFPFISIMENIILGLGKYIFRKKMMRKSVMNKRTSVSGVTSPIRERLGATHFLFNKLFNVRWIWSLAFRVMDLFLPGNFGSTYFVICRRT